MCNDLGCAWLKKNTLPNIICKHAPGVLIWCYGTTVGARATDSGVKHEIYGARASLLLHVFTLIEVSEK